MHERSPAAHGRSGRLHGARLLALCTLLACSPIAFAQPMLSCVLKAPAQVVAGAPVFLRFIVKNQGSSAVQVLEWNTPFEGWFAPYVQVSRDGAPLAYKGPSMKRGDPGADEYVRIAAGRSRTAKANLADAFDFSVPGSYRVEPQITLFDVIRAGQALPRPRAELVPQPLSCNPVEIVVTARRP